MSFFGQGAPNPDKPPDALETTYLEYLEFRYDEFRKFSRMPPVTKEEIDRTDMDELCRRLYDG